MLTGIYPRQRATRPHVTHPSAVLLQDPRLQTHRGFDQTGADATGLDFIAAPESSFLSLVRSAALMILGRKRSLFSHILCMIIASFRATAILAFENPIRLARRTPHAFRLFQSFE